MDPRLYRWQVPFRGAIRDRDDIHGKGLLRLASNRAGVLFYQGFARPPRNIYWQPLADWGRKLWCAARRLWKPGIVIVPSGITPTQSGVSHVLDSTRNAASTRSATPANGLLGQPPVQVRFGLPRPEGKQEGIETLAGESRPGTLGLRSCSRQERTREMPREPTRWIEAPEVKAIADRLIPRYHSHLRSWSEEIRYAFRDEAQVSKGRTVWGKAHKISGLACYLATNAPGEPNAFEDTPAPPADMFVMEIAADIWERLNDRQREALVDHELCHFTIDFDDNAWVVEHSEGWCAASVATTSRSSARSPSATGPGSRTWPSSPRRCS